jgi:hypothetical protein
MQSQEVKSHRHEGKDALIEEHRCIDMNATIQIKRDLILLCQGYVTFLIATYTNSL